MRAQAEPTRQYNLEEIIMERYQVQIQAVLVGSKETRTPPAADAPALMQAISAQLLSKLSRRTFSTGSEGFFVSGKVSVE